MQMVIKDLFITQAISKGRFSGIPLGVEVQSIGKFSLFSQVGEVVCKGDFIFRVLMSFVTVVIMLRVLGI
jgi:hypothetical protein